MKKKKKQNHKLWITPSIYMLLCVGIIFVGIFFWRDIYTGIQQRYYQFVDRDVRTKQSRVESFTIHAPSLNDDEREIRVYVPKMYDQQQDSRYPVLYMLHGDPGNTEDWLNNADFQDTIDSLIARKEIHPMLVVFPDGRGVTTQDSQYVNATKVDQRIEDFIVQDVVREIDSKYRTIADRSGRSLGGASSGGYAALNIGIHHNDTFGVLISFSGYFINNEWVVKTLFENDQKTLQKNNPLFTIDQYKLNPSTFIFLQIGDTDYPTFISQNRQMDSKLKKYGIPHTLLFTEGSHGWDMWRNSLSDGLKYVSEHINQAKQ